MTRLWIKTFYNHNNFNSRTVCLLHQRLRIMIRELKIFLTISLGKRLKKVAIDFHNDKNIEKDWRQKINIV